MASMDLDRVIDFLMDLMRDDQKRSDFDSDPGKTLSDCGLGGITTHDVDDAEMVMRDSGLAHPRGEGSTSGGHHNPVDAIRHVSTSYVVDRSVHVGAIHEEFTVVDIDVDDRDVDIKDAYNGDTHVVAIQDNDTHNTDVDVVNVDHSFNDNPARTVEEPDSPDGAEPSDSGPSAAAGPDTEPDTEPATELEPDSDPDPVGHDPALSDPDHEHVDYYAEDAADAHAPVM
jgi:hypothetical protein